ncbi:hypothetical protein CK936_24085 [Streptomyces albireticuli]|uniref:SCO6045-like C-terminal domain-containing protein n=1 Tax=Streptomyces albireticuli TaxID=1940 RepID=A0A2A2D1S6_9ACTN|nr:hypothetical protein CK936_24085 [Streptomyces albireticuli]
MPVSDVPLPDGPMSDGPMSDGPMSDVAVPDGRLPDAPVPDVPVPDAPVRGVARTTGAPRPAAGDSAAAPDPDAAARERLAHAQLALLSTLVAGGPEPEGFDPVRLEVQRRALLGKRAHVVAKVAPELRDILGPRFHELFLGYARERPMTDGYHRDALDFARGVLRTGALEADPERHRRLTDWEAERTAHTACTACTARSGSAGRPPLLSRLAAALGSRRAERRRKGN